MVRLGTNQAHTKLGSLCLLLYRRCLKIVVDCSSHVILQMGKLRPRKDEYLIGVSALGLGSPGAPAGAADGRGRLWLQAEVNIDMMCLHCNPSPPGCRLHPPWHPSQEGKGAGQEVGLEKPLLGQRLGHLHTGARGPKSQDTSSQGAWVVPGRE